MYLGSWKYGDYLTWAANTHDPATAQAADATSIIYRIYEEDTAAPILSGVMSKLDDPNTIGFYYAKIQLTQAAGFEQGKSYIIYVEAEVAGVVGTMNHNFQIRADVSVPLGTGLVAYTYTLHDSATGLDIPSASVWVSTDVGGTNVIVSGLTNVFGQVTFYLDPGTYQFWGWKAGYSIMGPDQEVVT